MLCSRFLKPESESEKKPGRLFRWSERGFDTMLGLYARTLGPALRHPRRILAMSAIVLVATGWMFVKIPKGFLPTEDQGLIFGSTEAAQGIGFPAMREKQQQIGAIVRADPDVANVLISAGPRGNTAVGNSGIVLAQLKPPRGAPQDGRRDRRGAAAAVREGPGDPRIPAGAAADPPRRQPDEEPVPVHAPGFGHGGALQVRPDPRGQDPRAAGSPGRHERHAALESAAERGDRPRPRGRARHHDAEDRGRPLHRVRHAPDLDDLRADQPVPGHHGARARVPGHGRRDRPALRARGHGRPRAVFLARVRSRRARAR